MEFIKSVDHNNTVLLFFFQKNVRYGTSTATGTVAITGTGNGTGTIHIGFFNDIIMITLASNNCFCQIYCFH